MGIITSRVSYLDSQIPYGDTSNEKRFEIWLMCCCISWLFGMISVYSYFSFTRLSHLSIISSRYPTMVRIECVMVMLLCFICWPFFAATGSRLQEFVAIEKDIDIIAWFVYPFLSHGIVDIEACRCWCMYFKLNHLYFTKNKKWTDVINTDENSNNFFLTNTETWGNVKWCSKRIFCYYLFTAFSSMLMINFFGYNVITQFIDATFYGFPVIVVIYCYSKCPKIRDKFLFYFEFTTSAWFYISGLTIYFCNVITFWFNMYYASIAVTFIGLYSIPSVSILSALVIPKMIFFNPVWNVHNIKNKTAAALAATSHATKSNSSLSEMHRQRALTEIQLSITMQTIFKKPALLQLFVSHVLHEFCVENILAYIEMKQFRDAFAMKCGLSGSDATEAYLYQLPDHETHQIPRSKIVFDKLDLEKHYSNDELKQVAKTIFINLYEKYITVNATNQVNIAHELRKQYEALLLVKEWNVTLHEILKLYDPILREISYLLRDVKYRFVRSEEFILHNAPSDSDLV